MPTVEAQERRTQLWNNVAHYHALLSEFCTAQSPILPVRVGENSQALRLSDALLSNGFLAPAIRYPTVPHNQARIRITLSAKHSAQEIERLTKFLRAELQKTKAAEEQ
jgi:7-keto-8-aminopelargonate synthetase-like enzyme